MQYRVCPVCYKKTLRRHVGEFKCRVGSRKVVVPSVERDVCDSCGEEFFDRQAGQEIDRHVFGKRALSYRA